MEAQGKLKRIFAIIGDVLMYAFIAICIVGVLISLTSKKNPDGAATVLGMQFRLVLSESMAECELTDTSEYDIKDIPLGSLIFIKTVPEDPEKAAKWYDDVDLGDVLTFKYVYTTQETITHRVTGIDNTKGYPIFRLDGDNKNSDSETLTQIIDTSLSNSPNYIVGKVVGQSYLLGLLVRALNSPIGMIFIVIVPALLIILLEVIKI